MVRKLLEDTGVPLYSVIKQYSFGFGTLVANKKCNLHNKLECIYLHTMHHYHFMLLCEHFCPSSMQVQRTGHNKLVQIKLYCVR